MQGERGKSVERPRGSQCMTQSESFWALRCTVRAQAKHSRSCKHVLNVDHKRLRCPDVGTATGTGRAGRVVLRGPYNCPRASP